MATSAADFRDLKMLARSYRAELVRVWDEFVDRREAVELLGLAVLCREHVLFVGPPGTAKTSLLNRFQQMLDARYFNYLLTRFTEPAELFGPLDVQLFLDNSIYKINTENMLPKAHVALLDEVFQGGSAILNTLLTLMNERVFNDGVKVSRSPLITLLGATNEIPDDPVLAAFGDRFLLRCRLSYVPNDALVDVLRRGWSGEQQVISGIDDSDVDERDGDERDGGERDAEDGGAGGAGGDGGGPAREPGDRHRRTFALRDVRRLQRAVGEVDITAVQGPFAAVVRSMRAEGVVFSDRRAVRAQKVFAASALLDGRRAAELADLRWLANMWADERDAASLRRIVADHGVPLATPAAAVESPAVLRFRLADLSARGARATGVAHYREMLRELNILIEQLQRDHPDEQALLGEARALRLAIVAEFRQRYEAEEYRGG